MMKKELWLFGLMILPAVFTYGTSRAQNSGDFYDSLLISDELKTEENAEEAKDSAGRLLDAKPREIKIDSPLLRSHQEKLKKAKRAQLAKKKNKTLAENEPGPFGLAWGANYDEVKKEGVSLSAVGQKDYVNNFSATHLPKSVKTFREVILTFGIENELWRIIAYGNLLQDTPSAEKVLDLYNQYYKLLEQKYGNAQQFYTPKVINVDQPVGNGKQQGKPRYNRIPRRAAHAAEQSAAVRQARKAKQHKRRTRDRYRKVRAERALRKRLRSA